MSFVWGEDNIRFLRQRFDALQTSTLFRGMEYSENPQQIREWAPLVMDGRDTFQKVAATRMAMGTDVNFGEMTQQLLAALQQYPSFICIFSMTWWISSATPIKHGACVLPITAMAADSPRCAPAMSLSAAVARH